ncbi:unnamed protein product [Oppiella nova]|uniref:Uncharacterized protein n=1 Tax=Oppiella nova TaxID=334625 RepID=A0A7R9M4A2_9ACAR|nr:unnamed protein product [Oppiella nova]CAG2169989.1 unnamed protein product [Oppiella nova]
MKTCVDTIESFKSKTKKIAETLVLEKFPQKIVELEELLKNEKFLGDFDVSPEGIHIPEALDVSSQSANGQSLSSNQLNSHLDETSTRVDVNGIDVKPESDCDKSSSQSLVVVESNPYLREMIALLRPQMWELIEHTLTLSVGINLMIPQIEDGNNFGVQIQQECIDTIIGAENDVHKRLREICSYYATRAELMTKVVKYPHNEDYRCAVIERDRVFQKFLCGSLISIRNHYMYIHDLIALRGLNRFGVHHKLLKGCNGVCGGRPSGVVTRRAFHEGQFPMRPSVYQWRKFKDQLHFYIMLGVAVDVHQEW